MRRGRRAGLPDGWEGILAQWVADWSRLDAGERDRLAATTDQLLREKRWEPSRDFALTDEMRTALAGQAALLVLAVDDDDPYREVGSIVVHPRTIVRRGPRPGPVAGVVTDHPRPLQGEASHGRGPVMIAWDAARRDARHRGRGHNVVYHEFAHKLDMLDHVVDGTPPLPDPARVQRWIEVCTDVYERVREGDATLLRSYAGVDAGEFFAVATEAFFDTPEAAATTEPDLYTVLRDYYGQDPAARRGG